MDQNLIRFIPADIGLDAPGGQPAVERQLFPGDGVIAVMLRHSGRENSSRESLWKEKLWILMSYRSFCP